MKVYIVDSSGHLRFSGNAGPKTVRLLAIDGNIDVGEAPPNNHSIWNGSAWVVDPAWFAVQYKEDRRIAYGKIGAELDMIYWDQVNGTTTFKDHVAAVKADNPKPEE